MDESPGHHEDGHWWKREEQKEKDAQINRVDMQEIYLRQVSREEERGREREREEE